MGEVGRGGKGSGLDFCYSCGWGCGRCCAYGGESNTVIGVRRTGERKVNGQNEEWADRKGEMEYIINCINGFRGGWAPVNYWSFFSPPSPTGWCVKNLVGLFTHHEASLEGDGGHKAMHVMPAVGFPHLPPFSLTTLSLLTIISKSTSYPLSCSAFSPSRQHDTVWVE